MERDVMSIIGDLWDEQLPYQLTGTLLDRKVDQKKRVMVPAMWKEAFIDDENPNGSGFLVPVFGQFSYAMLFPPKNLGRVISNMEDVELRAAVLANSQRNKFDNQRRIRLAETPLRDQHLVGFIGLGTHALVGDANIINSMASRYEELLTVRGPDED